MFDPPFPSLSIYLFNTRQRTISKKNSATLSVIIIQFKKYAPKSVIDNMKTYLSDNKT